MSSEAYKPSIKKGMMSAGIYEFAVKELHIYIIGQKKKHLGFKANTGGVGNGLEGW